MRLQYLCCPADFLCRVALCTIVTLSKDKMLTADCLSFRQLIAYKRSQERDSPRKFAAHNALYRQVEAANYRPPRPPRTTLQVESIPRRVAEEANALSLLINRLILDDLA